MKYLILASGRIEPSELAELAHDLCSHHTLNLDEALPLNLFSLLLSEIKLFDEATGDEQAPVTTVMRPEEAHTALVFDDEPAMIRAKLLLHGLVDSRWSADSHLSHAVRFAANFTATQLNEAALQGAQLHRLMAVESVYRSAAEALIDPEYCDAATQNRIVSDSQAGLEEVVGARIETTRRLIEIQTGFGICPCQG